METANGTQWTTWKHVPAGASVAYVGACVWSSRQQAEQCEDWRTVASVEPGRTYRVTYADGSWTTHAPAAKVLWKPAPAKDDDGMFAALQDAAALAAAARDALAARDAAIVTAVRQGASYRTVGTLVGLSHERVRVIVSAA